jgi:hypothetical protein
LASSLVYYAMGGGLGHLARARAVLYTLGYTGHVTLISASAHARDPRVIGDWDVALVPASLEHDPHAFARWIDVTLTAACAERLCVDVFPAGILGELCGLRATGIELWHVARRLRWSQYNTRLAGPALTFERTFLLEPLEDAHEAYLRSHSRSVERLCLRDPPCEPVLAPLTAAAHWLVVHSGPAAEVEALLAYATELRAREDDRVELWVLTPQSLARLPAQTFVQDVYPAQRHFAAADRIISAAGFNIMRQCAPYRAKHTVLPMPRRYDDQFERTVQSRRFGNGADGTRRQAGRATWADRPLEDPADSEACPG